MFYTQTDCDSTPVRNAGRSADPHLTGSGSGGRKHHLSYITSK